MTVTDTNAETSPTTTPPGVSGAADQNLALFIRVRTWMWEQNASSWVADAFGHWVITEIAPREPVPERLSDLWVRWSYDAVPRRYRARHAARLSGSAPWMPGDPLPEPGAP